MGFLSPRDREDTRELLGRLDRDVRLIYFTERHSPAAPTASTCDTCHETRLLLEDVASLSDWVRLEIHDFATESELATEYGILRIPGLVMMAEGIKGRVRYFGMPSGYEFPILIGSLVSAAKLQTDLRESTKIALRELRAAVHIQVFVTPTCSYCAPMARMAHQMAMENARVASDVIAINEFEELARRYVIQGVPKTVINDRVEIIGAVAEEQFMEHVQRAV